MKFEIENGEFVGTVEWQGPGRVALDVPNEKEREVLERYFTAPTSRLPSESDHEGMTYERPGDSEAAFNRALYDLSGRAYEVRPAGRRREEART